MSSANSSDSPYTAAPANAHKLDDSKDQQSLKNKLAKAENEHHDNDGANSHGPNADETKIAEQELAKKEPVALAKSHGNEPSQGAKIDQQIKDEEEQELKNKGKA